MANVKVVKDLENKKLVIEFTAHAPKNKVWRAYADQAWFEKWWGPEGWVTVAEEFNFRPGGFIHYGMKCIDERQTDWYGQTSWGLMDISDVQPGESFTYQDFFSDESGARNTEMPVLTITNEFVEDGNKTRIISTSIADNAEQIDALLAMGMVEGFSSQLKKLDELVA